MPVKADHPVTIKNEVDDVNVLRVSGIRIAMPAKGYTLTALYVDRGQSQGDGSTIWIDQIEHIIRNEEEAPYLDQVIASTTSGGIIYDELKTIVYDHALARGWVPAGAVL